MTDKYVEEVIKTEGMTLSQLAWRLLRRLPRGYVERVLDLNPGMDLTSPFLPVGSVVRLPMEITEDTSSDASVVRLWD